MTATPDYSLYFVTPPADHDGLEALVAAALRGGAGIVQLRDKTATDDALIPLAKRLKALTAAHGARLIINDRVAVALAADADGVHVGQGDTPAAEVRAAIGPGKLLGLSVSTPAQLAALPVAALDYIGVGPFRATGTKPDHNRPIGAAGLAEIVRDAPLPAIAIGGLTLEDVPAVRAAGCAGMAVVSAISAADDAEAAARALAKAWRESA